MTRGLEVRLKIPDDLWNDEDWDKKGKLAKVGDNLLTGSAAGLATTFFAYAGSLTSLFYIGALVGSLITTGFIYSALILT